MKHSSQVAYLSLLVALTAGILLGCFPAVRAQLAGQTLWNMGPSADGSEFEIRYGSVNMLRLGVNSVGAAFAYTASTFAEVCNGENILVNGGAEVGSGSGWDTTDASTRVFNLCDTTSTRCQDNANVKSGMYAWDVGDAPAPNGAIAMRQLGSVSSYDTGETIEFSGWVYQFPGDTLEASMTFYGSDGTTTVGTTVRTALTVTYNPALAFYNFENETVGNYDVLADKANHAGPLSYDSTVGTTGGVFTVPKSTGASYQPINMKQWALGGSTSFLDGNPLRVSLTNYLSPSDSSFTLLMTVRLGSSSALMTLAELYASSDAANNFVAFYADTANTRLEWSGSVAGSALSGNGGTLVASDWHVVALVYDASGGGSLSLWMTQSSDFSSPLLTESGIFSSRIDTMLLGQDTDATPRGLSSSQIDLVTLVRGTLDATGLNAYKQAIENNNLRNDFNFGYRQFTVMAAKPAGAAYAEGKLVASDSNGDTDIKIVLDDLSLRCVPYN